MEALVDKAMKDGAWGLSTGLIYNPGTYAKTDEIDRAWRRSRRKHGGIYASHIRDEGGGLLDAIEEALTDRPARPGCRVHISHIKACGQGGVGQVGRRRRADRDGPQEGAGGDRRPVPVHRQQHVAAGHAGPDAVPRGDATRSSSPGSTTRRPGRRSKADIEKALDGRDGGKRIQIARYAKNPKWQGKNLAAIAEAEKKEPIDIVLEIERNGGAQVVNFGMSEEDVRLYMKQPWVATASDGGVQIARRHGAAPAELRHLPAQDRPLRHRGRSSSRWSRRSAARSGLPADILRADRPRLPEAGLLRRRGGVRPEDVPRHGDVRQAAPVRGRREVAVRQRQRRRSTDGKHDATALAGRVLRHKQKS